MTKFMSVALAGMLVLGTGCSQLRKGFEDDQGKLDEQKISDRVAFIAGIALNLEAVQPYKQQVCSAIQVAATELRNVEDKDVTEERLREILQESLDKYLPDGNIKDVTVLVIDFVVERTFDLVWDKYRGLLESDPAIVARGLAFGLESACEGGVSLFSADDVDTSELEAKLEEVLD